VIKVQRTDFYDHYVAFKEANPSKAAEIDKLFVEHGFFVDTIEGNGVRDRFEGFRDANNNRRYDVGEVFFDLGCLNSTSEIEYRKGMVIGKAANYERLNRSSAVRLDGAYLKVKDDEVSQYLVKVHYLESGYGEDYEYVVDLRDGLVYVQPLPGDVEAEISIEPYSVEYVAEDIYSISNQELISKLEVPDEYFAEHKFSLEKTGATGDLEYVVYKDTDPSYAYEGDRGQDVDVKISDAEPGAEGKKGFPLVWLVLIPILGAGAFFLRKGDNREKAQVLIKKGSQEVNEKGLPAIKQASKKAAEYTAKGAEYAAQQAKEGYEKAKPQIKKAQEDIKKKIDQSKEKKE
jgi:F0F1-type ATP synthase epsilon subunit